MNSDDPRLHRVRAANEAYLTLQAPFTDVSSFAELEVQAQTAASLSRVTHLTEQYMFSNLVKAVQGLPPVYQNYVLQRFRTLNAQLQQKQEQLRAENMELMRDRIEREPPPDPSERLRDILDGYEIDEFRPDDDLTGPEES